MKTKIRLRKRLFSFAIALVIVIGTFSGVVPGTSMTSYAAEIAIIKPYEIPASWEKDDSAHTLNDFEGFQSTSFEAVTALAGTDYIPNIGSCVVVYDYVEDHYVGVCFNNGSYAGIVNLYFHYITYNACALNSSFYYTTGVISDSFTVKLNTNGGTINNGNITEYTEGTGATLPTETDIIRDGYTFGGWYANSDFSGDPVTSISETETGNKEYWANWTMAGDMQIFIKGISGGSKSITVYNSDTIAITKNKIVDVFNTSQGVKRLIFAGKVLEGDKTLADYNIQKESTLHVIFDNEYTVSFNTNGGSAVSSQTLVSGSKVTVPEDPEKDSYTFAGWYSDEGLTSQYNFDDEVTSDFTLYANWIPVTYTVTLHANGGTIADGKNVTGYTYGTGATLPTDSDMSRNGYIFDGWYDNEELTGEVVTSISTTDTGNKGYWAKWTSNKYTITFVNDDNTKISSVEYDYGTSANDIVKPSNPTKSATAQYTYTFAGWDSEVTVVTADKTYKATYTSLVNKYTVTFKDYDGRTVLDSQQVNYGQAATAPSNPTRTGYTFIGWNKTFNNVTENLVVTAQYRINKYTIKFVDDDNTEISSAKYNYGTSANNIVKPSNPKKSATAQYTYKFAGWDSEISDVTGNKTYKATYTSAVNKYTVTFDSNGGNDIDSQSVDYGTKATAPKDPTNGNLHFIGWFVDPTIDNIFNYETFEYNTFDFDTEITSDITLKALWSTRLNVNTKGCGQIATAESGGELEYDEEYTITSTSELAIIGLYDSFDVEAKPDEGYHFVKWTKDGDDYSTDSKITITLENDMVELVAVFEIDTYDVTFDSNGHGTAPVSQSVVYGSTITKPKDISAEGYTFAGWFKEKKCKNEWDFNKDTVKEDTVIYAKWIELGEKEIATDVKKDENSPELNTSDLTKELADSTLSNEEKDKIDEAIEQGQDVDVEVYLEINDISESVSTDDKEKITALVSDADDIKYFDISLFKEISISGQSQGATSLHELTSPIKLTIAVPESFPAVAAGYTRIYTVIRIHEGIAEKLPTTLNADGTLTFETDKFSTYALSYTDSAVDAGKDEDEDKDKDRDKDKDAEEIRTVDMYRLYNPNSGEHFYTANVSEKDNLLSLGWRNEGIGWKAPVSSNTPVYRLYNPNAGDHHFTMNIDERDFLISVGWKYEGIGWYSDDAKTVPLYRQYNPNAKSGTHNYTANKSENDWLVSLGWRYEGIGWYGVK